MFKLITVLIAFITTVIAADFDPQFLGLNLDQELRANFRGFKAHIQKSSYYQPSLNTTPPVDFVMLLTNRVATTPNVCRALDYLIKTGGPFGMNRKKATSQESAFLAAAAQIIVEQDASFADKTYDAIRPLIPGSAEARHLAKVLEIQQKIRGGDLSHPLRAPLVLPAAATDIAAHLQPDVNKGWELFKGLLRDPNLFKEGRLVAEPSYSSYKGQKFASSWLNDVEILGYQMGVVSDIHGVYIDGLWANNNPWMESQHNYVQWWFPIHTRGMGDGLKAPRFLDTTNTIFQNNACVRTYVQQMMRVSFARKAHFWGQRIVDNGDGTLRLEKLVGESDDWEANWITSTHNYARMNRFLQSLRFFGLIPERDALFDYLTRIKDIAIDPTKSIENNPDLTKEIKAKADSLKGSFDGFWQPSVTKPLDDNY